MVEVRKRLIGDTGDTLITPYRVCSILRDECIFLTNGSLFVRVCMYVETSQGGRAVEILKKGETAADVLLSKPIFWVCNTVCALHVHGSCYCF